MISTRTLSAVVVLLPLLSTGCASVAPGNIGVLWTTASGTQRETYREGLHAIAPWNELSIYDLRVQNHDELLNVIAANGLAIQLDASRYQLIAAEVVALQEQIGPKFYDKILEPVLRSEARRVIGQYTPEEIYSTKRDVIEREIREGVKAKIAGSHIALDAVLIRNVELPVAIRTAIDQKLAAEQDVLKQRYVLEVDKVKAEESRIEAQGIADYNRLIAATLSSAVLEFERIQQLSSLARSPNAKTVVLGPGLEHSSLLLQTPKE
jgi:regulator of protease activity HflC (stomatin/prohibitin superfamily)